MTPPDESPSPNPPPQFSGPPKASAASSVSSVSSSVSSVSSVSSSAASSSSFSLLTSNFQLPTSEFRVPTSALGCPALTLVETLLAALLLTILLWLTTGLYTRQLNIARTAQARTMLHTLDTALTAYHDATGTYPPGTLHGAADQAIAAMLNHPASGRHLETLDLALLHMRAGRPRCIDPWGKRLRYISQDIAQPQLKKRFQTNADKPIFDSPGPDRTLGLPTQPQAADDLSSNEPTP